MLCSLFFVTSCDKTEKTETQEALDNEVNVILLIGQSNAEGHTWSNMLNQNNSSLYGKYNGNNESKVKIMYHVDALGAKRHNDEFESINLGMGYDGTRYGPEIGMSEVFDEADLERDLYIIKYTAGGTNLYTQWHSTNSPKGAGVLYTGLLNFVFDAMSVLEEEGLYPYLKGICWMQGESDSTSDHLDYADNYQEYEDTFINDLNEDLSYYKEDEAEVFKFINAAISNSSPWFNFRKINNAKYNNCLLDEENRYYLDTIKLGLSYMMEPTNNVDLYHYDSLAMIKLGKEFANALLSFEVL